MHRLKTPGAFLILLATAAAPASAAAMRSYTATNLLENARITTRSDTPDAAPPSAAALLVRIASTLACSLVDRTRPECLVQVQSLPSGPVGNRDAAISNALETLLASAESLSSEMPALDLSPASSGLTEGVDYSMPAR